MDTVVDRKNPPSLPPDHLYGRVLRPRDMLTHTRYAMAEPTEALRPWVKRYWSVAWDLAEGERFRTATVSEPTINLTIERGDLTRANTSGAGIWLTGPVTKERFDVGIHGTGGVIGVNFHLGATTALTPHRPAEIRDTSVLATTWFPGIDDELVVPNDLHTAAEVLDRWLLACAPVLTPEYSRLTGALAVMADPDVTDLGELSARCGLSERSLQRMFREYCGVGVKRILVRSRVMDAVAAIDRGWSGTLGDLGAKLGWFDQSHFTADFAKVTGYRPGEYAEFVGGDG